MIRNSFDGGRGVSPVTVRDLNSHGCSPAAALRFCLGTSTRSGKRKIKVSVEVPSCICSSHIAQQSGRKQICQLSLPQSNAYWTAAAVVAAPLLQPPGDG